MIDKALQIVAPHHCYGCGSKQALLCDNCKYDITSNQFYGCIGCGRPAPDGICTRCQSGFSRAWCIGERSGELEALINGYKFERKKASSVVCVDLLQLVLPELPRDICIVPVPTIRRHIRQRGYDHTALVAKGLAKRRSLTYRQALRRITSSVQLGATRAQRIEQAKQAFECTTSLAEQTVLLVDDVTTTGATLEYAATELRKAGAKDVWAAVIARQPLEKHV
ncbi:MAG TPA: phosphoribosyltransferase family protein [Candidatus Saccharibacteria bacterium]|nr:phosphoribosyltransferase family protein [Candidatus Saccharibacteria bacterium]HRJ90675.1 phosphoribosyltransferase family protein [Candidatus Saccharibacteria bacterium]